MFYLLLQVVVPGNKNNITIAGLDQYKEYIVSVSASTIAGEGLHSAWETTKSEYIHNNNYSYIAILSIHYFSNVI